MLEESGLPRLPVTEDITRVQIPYTPPIMPLKNRKKRKAYHAGYWKKYYSDPVRKARHLKAVRKNDKKRMDALRAWAIVYKLEHGCRVCGFKDHHAALDFAHRDRATKEFDIGDALRRGWSLAKVQKEAAKCDVLCANHHRIETYIESH